MSEKLSERIQEVINRDSILSYSYVVDVLIPGIKLLECRLAKVNGLLVDNYPCYDENGCKNCVGDFDEIDYRTCVGYNVLTALRGKEE